MGGCSKIDLRMELISCMQHRLIDNYNSLYTAQVRTYTDVGELLNEVRITIKISLVISKQHAQHG